MTSPGARTDQARRTRPTRQVVPGATHEVVRGHQIKAELIYRRGPWRTVAQLEFALFEYLDWWNHRRLHGELGMLTPADKEATYHATQIAQTSPETGQAAS